MEKRGLSYGDGSTLANSDVPQLPAHVAAVVEMVDGVWLACLFG